MSNPADDEYDDLVYAVRAAFKAPKPWHYSDDMDDWLASMGMKSYSEQEMEQAEQRQLAQESARTALMKVGVKALAAVRRGLRLSGGWREPLLAVLEKYGGSEPDREVLRLVAVRRTDPLAKAARKLLRRWGEDTSDLRSRPRDGPTARELAHQDRLARLVEMCGEPTRVRAMMAVFGLWDRRNFKRNYLGELVGNHLVESCGTRGPLRDCYRITEAGQAWLAERTQKSE